MKLRIRDHRSEQRIEMDGVVKYQHLASIRDFDNARSFVIFRTLEPKVETYIEEIVSGKLTDSLLSAGYLKQIPEDDLWVTLYELAKTHGILK